MSLSLCIPENIRVRNRMKGIERVWKKSVGFICFFLVSATVFSQTCVTQIKNPWEWPSHSNWIIGNGLKGKFSGSGISISPIPNVTTYEGTSGASDDWGNLLFLANGRRVWDPQGNLKYSGLLEGNEGGSMDNGSASQGIITVRHPLDTTNYYIFTVDDALTGKSNGLNYFVLDRKGNVKSGPVRLGSYRTSEGISATRHKNGVDIWITVYVSGSTDFNTYLLTCSGVIKTPVVSSVAPVKTGEQERGGIAFSWDSKYFVQAHPDYYPNSDKEVTVYKFDNQTGIISDPHHISNSGSVENPYDVTFSPDNTKLYVSTGFGTLECYDISSWNTATMAASLKMIAGVNTGSHSAIEIGGDGNLYMASPFGNMLKLTGNLNSGTLTASPVSGATTARGLPTMYLPPYEAPKIIPAGPFCSTDPAVDLSTIWVCSGLNAEDPVGYPDVYSGTGITNKGTGIFNPADAGPGKHLITFKRCNAMDTMFIEVKSCACPDTSLKPMPPICTGDSINLDLYKITTERGTWKLMSTPAGSTASLNGSLFISNHTVAGNYVVRFTLSSPKAGCPDYAERTIIIHALPIVSATSGIINCYGESTTCNATGANTYTWSNGDTGSKITVAPLSNTTYTVTGVDNNGCKDTAQILVIVPPGMHITTTFTNVNCLGKDNGTATVSVTGGVSPYSYTWNNGQQQATLTNLSPGKYTVLITDGKSCTDTASVVIGSPVLPVADFTFSSTCLGTAVTFQDASLPGSGNIITSYKWDFGDPGNAPNTHYTRLPEPHLYNATGTYIVTLVIRTDNGCADSIAKPIEVSPTPVVDFGSPQSGCKPVCAELIDLSTISSGKIVKWKWNFGDGNTSEEKRSNHCYTNPGKYHVTLTVESDKGCKASLTKNNLIDVWDSPKAAFTSDVQEAEIFNPNIRFFDQSVGANSWHWDFGVTSQPNDTACVPQTRWTYADTGTYNVCLTVKNTIGCADVICHPVTIKPYWTFYVPNAFTPNGDGTNDFFNASGYNIIEFQLWIYDRWGNMIYTTGKASEPATAKAWDGRANDGAETAQQDVYVWKVALKDIFKKPHHYVGTVTIVK